LKQEVIYVVFLQIVRVSAIQTKKVVDTTGAGDLFASGFLYGMINHLSLEDCCKIGCCAGAAVVQALGGEITHENRVWMVQQLNSQKLPYEPIIKV
jgi:sugar/nucleoside kinase (ribokinase family)